MQYTPMGRVTAGSSTWSTQPGEGEGLLCAARARRGMDGSVGEARLVLHPTGPAAPAPGEPIQLSLDLGDGELPVFSGEVAEVGCEVSGLRVLAVDALSRLARAEVEGVWEEQTVGAIVADLLSQVGAEEGELEEGPSLPRVTLHTGPRALRHARDLAARAGMDLWTDGEGKIILRSPKTTGAEHALDWGEGLLSVRLGQTGASPDGWTVFGEGAASGSGAEKAHWLPTKLDGARSEAAVSAEGVKLSAKVGEKGERPRRVVDGALRSGELVESVAKALAEARAARPVLGLIELLGKPEIEPGDLVTLSGLPEGHAAAAFAADPLRVRVVSHHLDARGGLRSRLEIG